MEADRSAMNPGSHLFVFGLGYSAAAFGRRMRARGWRVSGTTRGAERQAALRADGFEAHLFARGGGFDPALLADVTHLLSSIPPDESGDSVLDTLAVHIAALPRLAWCGYLSTTGVYGDRGGDWVDEDSPLRPSGQRSQRRIDAERRWLALQGVGLPAHIFRLAGIYGPGRSALDSVRAGSARRVVKPGQVFSRIHADDIAAVLDASIARPAPGTIYNVCDDAAAPPQDVVAYACELLGIEPPPEIPYDQAAPTMSAMARSFFADSKRVSNRRIRERLGVTLAYPDYRAGLRAILAAENS
jgi:nucleoside-diphosphate-sugar epimerase